MQQLMGNTGCVPQAHETIGQRREELAAARIQKRHNEEYEVNPHSARFASHVQS